MDIKARKTLLQRIPHGVYVVGVTNSSGPTGFTATWVSQVSFDPSLVMIGVKKDSHAATAIKAGQVFSINFLNRKQKKIAETFFNPPPQDGNMLGGTPYHTGRTGAPLLDEAIGYLDCVVREITSPGDHLVVIGEVVEARLGKELEPLTLGDAQWQYGG
jgi:flavin reductase (DIM6/NTAB) family NADH-FMN oxidoreductase RutF